jgi:imidazolonepropionase-like amidohydrolase
MEAFEAIPYNAAIMTNRGVLTSLNSDDGNLARRLNLEAAKTVHYGGMDRQQALAMVTINPARQLKIDRRVGSLAKGKDADLVIWSGDPLSVYSAADMTFVDGKLRFGRERDAAHRPEVTQARDKLLAEMGAVGGAQAPTVAATAAATDWVDPPAPKFDYVFARGAGETPVAIVGPTVHTLEGPAIANGVVVFEHGRISAVGGPDTAVPTGATRIEGAGKHLWPGLIHTNAVLGINEIDSVPGSVDVTETGDVNADADVSLAVNAASAHFPVARSGGITQALIVPGGGIVSGTASLLRTDGWTWEEMSAVRNHSLVIRWADPIAPQFASFLGPPKSLAERKKDAEERVKSLDKLFDGAEAYGRAKREAQSAGRKWEYDAQLEALQPVLRGERPLWANAREKLAIEAAVGFAAKRKLRLVITDGRDAYLLTDLLAKHKVPVVLTNIVGEPPRADDPYDVLYSLPAKLEAAGVEFAIASTTRTGGSANARNIALFAGIAAGHGLDREAAYRSITLYPARILGVDGVLGSIRPGKSASLVLTDGDLLEATTNVEQVWIDGVAPSMDDIQKAAWRKWSARPKP